jgi:hypothetical protein
MPSYNAIKELDIVAMTLRKAGFEPIIVDGKLMALEASGLRIAPEKGGPLQVWESDESDA